MLRVLHLLSRDADFQTRHSVRVLREALDGEAELSVRTVGSLSNLTALRRERDRFDVVHAWDARCRRVALLAGFRNVVSERPSALLPPVSSGASDPSSRENLRERLGVSDDHFVILAPGESSRAAAHERAAWVGSILHVVDERYRVLLWGRGPRLDVAAELGEKLRQPGLVVVAQRVLKNDVEFQDLLPAADVLLVTATAPTP